MPNARIDVPSHSALIASGGQTAAGVAWSPPRGLVKVEIRVDGGPWQACTLAEPLGPSAWVHWRASWTAMPGRHTLEVRAWGRDGVQSELPAAPYPEGARGYHRVMVDARAACRSERRQMGWWLASVVRERCLLAWQGIAAWHKYRAHRK
jgi:hypothetical protein